MRQDHRTPFELALQRARASAYVLDEFVGQEGFMTATEIRALAVRAGVGPGVSVLDVGCGIGGPGAFLTRELGCDYLGVDFSESAVAIARERARDLPVPVRGRPRSAAARRRLRRRAPARGDARRRGQGAARARGRGGARAGRALRVHARGRAAAGRRRAGGDARSRHGVADPARRSGRIPGASRARGHVGRGPQPRAPGDGAGARGRLRRRGGGHHLAARRAARSRTSSPRTACGSSGWTTGRVRKLAVVAQASGIG